MEMRSFWLHRSGSWNFGQYFTSIFDTQFVRTKCSLLIRNGSKWFTPLFLAFCRWCHRIFPVQATCSWTKNDLRGVVMTLVKEFVKERHANSSSPLKVILCLFLSSLRICDILFNFCIIFPLQHLEFTQVHK